MEPADLAPAAHPPGRGTFMTVIVGSLLAAPFAAAGLKTIARHGPPRPIMRHDLKDIAP